MEKIGMKQPLVSVIIPIYNVASYVDACVDSVARQTYSNLEIVLVDDGSTDESSSLCDAWAQKDSRIKVIHQKNQGLSAARNAGTASSTGKYITFVDGDDELDENCIDSLWRLTNHGEISYTQCEYGELIAGKRILHGDQETEGELNSSSFIRSSNYLTMACGKLIRRDIVERYLFPIGKIHEDVAVMPRMCYDAERVAYTCKSLYFYNEREESINASSRYYLKHLDILEAMQKNIAFFEENDVNELSQWMRRQYIYELLSQYGKVKLYFPDRKDILKDIKKNLQEQVKKSMRDSEIKGKTKALLYVSSYIPELWITLTKD